MKPSKTLRALIVLVAVLALGSFGGSHAVRAEETRLTNPNALSAELLGRGLFYSLNYDRVLNEDLVAGFGFGSVSLQDSLGNDANTTLSMIPVYVNYYFTRDQGSLFVTGGATIIPNGSGNNGLSSKVGGLTLTSSPVLPTMGIGYENRGDSGFLFRVAAYGIVGKSYTPWFGFTFGYAF